MGIIGRELKSTLTDTWVHYAVPVHAHVEIVRDEKPFKMDMATFVRLAITGKYVETRLYKREERSGYHGIMLVPNAIERTPPYVEEVTANSPAATAGLRPDDLIMYANGELVPTIIAFRNVMKYIGPGSEVILDVQRREVGPDMVRQSRLMRVKLTLAEQPK